MRTLALFAVASLVISGPLQAGPFRTVRPASSVKPASGSSNTIVARPTTYSAGSPATVAAPANTTMVADALSEVNAARAQRGLRPFLPDPQLNQAALACAQIRAAKRIEGHLPNDFAYLPAGATARSAGCGAMAPSWGWGTCCTYENYTYAGAAWVMGSDGQRYMHLFVR